MIVEVVKWDIVPNKEEEFEKAFTKAQEILTKSAGYKSHQFQKCIEKENRYILIVEWASLDDHVNGFQKSASYEEYRSMLKPYYQPGATMEHYKIVHENG